MEIKVTYDGLEDRQEKVAKREAKGLRMLHDDFDPDWKLGDEPHGTLTFTDESPPAPPIIPDSPDMITLKKYLADPTTGSEEAFQALVRMYLGGK